MVNHDFDPWAEIQRLRCRPTKAANPAKPDPTLSRFSSISQAGSAATQEHRCSRCLGLQAQGVEILQCGTCGHHYPVPIVRLRTARNPRRVAGEPRLRLVKAEPGRLGQQGRGGGD
jgi:hypothetical protein